MKKALLALIALWTSLAVNAQTQEAWTLEKCIAHAYNNNLTMKQMNLQAQVSQNNYSQSKQELLPSARASASYGYSVGRYLNYYTNDFDTDANSSLNLSVSADVTLFDGFRTINSIKKYKIDAMTDQEAIEKVKRDISLEIGLAFLNIIRSEELLAAAKMQLETTDKQVDRTQKLVTAGSLPEGSLLEIKAQQAREQASVIDAENGLFMAKLGLVQLLDLPNVEGFEIAKPNLPAPGSEAISLSLEEVLANVDNLPEMRKAKLELQSAEKSLEIARSGYSPSLSLSGSIYTGYSQSRTRTVFGDPTEEAIGYLKSNGETVYTMYPSTSQESIAMGDQLRDNRYNQLNLSLSIPIYSKGRVKNQVSNAKVGILMAQTQLQQTKMGVYKAVQQALADAKAALAKYQSSNASVQASKLAFEYTEQKFTVGAIDAFEYNQAKSQLFQAQATLAQAKFDYIFRTKILDFYRGVPIVL